MDRTDVLSRPIIVLGAPRSGTSILGRLLSPSPGVAYANEPRLIWRYKNNTRSDIFPATSATPDVRSYIRRKFSEIVVDNSGSRLVEKSPNNSMRMGFVDKVFPDAIYVHILRNGYHSVESIERHWHTHTTGIAAKRVDARSSILVQRFNEAHWSQFPHYVVEFAKRLMPFKIANHKVPWGPRIPGLNQWANDLPIQQVAALQWRFCVEMACHYGRQLPKDRYVEIRLEDMNLNSLKAAVGFCDLKWTDDCEKFFEKEFVPISASKPKNESYPLENIEHMIQPTIDYYGLE